MLKNYLIITIRNFTRNKGYSFINISGLAVGFVCFILIAMWITDELHFDNFHKNIDHLYRVNTITDQGTIITNSSLKLGEELQSKYPEMESFTNFIPWARSLIKYQDKVFDERNIYLVDAAFFTMFSFDFVAGDSATVLQDKYSIVITDETAKRYFGEADPVGKLLYSDVYNRGFKVTAVVKKMPPNSTLQFNIAASINLMPRQRMESWEFSGWTYIQLKKNISEKIFNEKIKDFYTKNVNPEWNVQPKLQNFATIHLYEKGEPGLIKLVYILSTVAVFVLIIAMANFSNLSTARATKRALEVGIRKVNGAFKGQLIRQFLVESILTVLISLIIAIEMVHIILPFFNQFTGKTLEFFSGNIFLRVIGLFGLVIITGVIASGYPAFILSSFKPVSVLKGKSGLYKSGSLIRRALTISQFAISIGLIICTLIVSKQMRYIQEINLGMDREHILSLPNNPELKKRFDIFKSELLKIPAIENITASATQPFNVGQQIDINWEDHMNENPRSMQYTMVDYDFFSTLGIELQQGRTFSKQFATDSSYACVINETAASIMGFDNPVGKSLYFGHPAFPEERRNLKIIGVVKDFHSRSLHSKISPFVFKMFRPWHFNIFIKLNSSEIKNTIADIEKVTKKYAPGYPFTYEFLDDAYNNLYLMEIKTERILNIFAVIAIIISCLGLFGLAAFTTEQKTKEIGIRKVLGASVTCITLKISKQFAFWVLLANIIAWPVAWYAMNQWLQNFAYKIDMPWWLFTYSGGIAIFIALLTVSSQALKAGKVNPVEALKYE